MTRQRLFPVAAFVVALAAAAAAPAAGQALFGVPAFAPDPAPGARPDPWTSQRFSATVDAALLGAAGPREIALDMFGRRVVAVKDRSETDPSTGAVSYFGTVAGEPMSSVVFVAEQDGRVAGTVRTMNKSYTVLPQDDTIHSVAELDVRAFPAEAHPQVPKADLPPVPARFWTERRLAARQVATIDILVVYTPQVRMAVGGTANIEARIRLAVAETNQAYANSRINMVMRLAYMQEINYVANDMGQDLDRLTAVSDGYMDEVHILRNNYGADVVSLWTSVGAYCGIGWLMGTPSLDFAGWAFNVVHYSCATGYFTFGHEIGHNMGANHDRANSGGGGGSYPYSYGYQEPSGLWRTIMAYDCPNGCTRLQYFSNPEVTYNGRAMGVDSTLANSADVARTFNNHAQIMAAWRAEVTSPQTVTTWTVKTPTTTTSRTRTTSTTRSTTSRTTTTIPANGFVRCGGSFPIVDLGSRNSTLDADLASPLTRLSVQLDMQHTYLSDLTITLTRASDGLAAVLYRSAGCIPYATTRVTFAFDDAASAPLGTSCTGTVFKPLDALSRFLGAPAAGRWTLSVLDSWSQDTGTVFGWCMVGEAAPATSTAGGAESTTVPAQSTTAPARSTTVPAASTTVRAASTTQPAPTTTAPAQSSTETASATQTASTTSQSRTRTETASRTRTETASRTRTETATRTQTTSTTSNTRTTTDTKTRTTTDTKTRTKTTTKTRTATDTKTKTTSTTRTTRTTTVRTTRKGRWTTSVPARDVSKATTRKGAAVLPAKKTTRAPAADARATTRRVRRKTTRRRTTTRGARRRVAALQWG